MLQEVIELHDNAVSSLIDKIRRKNNVTFKSPTGSGKTYMMADLMNRILSERDDIVFIVSTLSKGNLGQQNYEKFIEYQQQGDFPMLKPYIISTSLSNEESLFIPTDYNVYVLPRDLYKEGGLLMRGTMANFLQEITANLYGSGTNKAVLMTAYLYCQSGYKMRLATADNHLFMLYASHHTIYDKNYWTIDGERYYPLDCKYNQVKICQATFPKEKPLSLYINTRQVFDRNPSNVRTLQSKRYPNVKATVRTNKNLIKFYDSYPTSCINDDFGTRWAMYANTPMDSESEQTLYPALRAAIKGLSEKEAVERLLNFVQTAFVYEYDDKVWGQDRAFFAEETLNYPYCDCEDRSILFSRLVRDLVGIDVALIYYPGHLATAVRFTETVKGDNVYANGKRYVICDPTYIGAPVGMTMPNMDNSQAKVILL